MLVLTRKIGEAVVIGDNVKITVVSVGPGRVKIGIEAPANVSVDREEVHSKKVAERAGEPVGPPTPAADPEPALSGSGLHNRIVAKLPPELLIAAVPAVAPQATPGSRLQKLRDRLPRKSR